MNTTKQFATLYVSNLLEDVFFNPQIIEKNFNLKVVKNNPDEICVLCQDGINTEIIKYKCVYCSCHLHHSCINNYTKDINLNKCFQCSRS